MAAVTADPAAFAAARAICGEHARTFYFASVFLPRPKREAAYAVYAFCRLLDDAADTGGDVSAYDRALTAAYAGTPADVGDAQARLALAAFADTVRRYDIPKRYFDDLAAGCRMDLTVNRYATWDALRVYCYHVAGVVGLVMCRIFGLADAAAERQAVVMGEAMQLTNILRDVGEDRGLGRIYLPAEDLARFGVRRGRPAGRRGERAVPAADAVRGRPGPVAVPGRGGRAGRAGRRRVAVHGRGHGRDLQRHPGRDRTAAVRRVRRPGPAVDAAEVAAAAGRPAAGAAAAGAPVPDVF